MSEKTNPKNFSFLDGTYRLIPHTRNGLYIFRWHRVSGDKISLADSLTQRILNAAFFVAIQPKKR